MAYTRDPGKAAEYLFAFELLDRGIIPNWPSSQMMPYDMIADTGIKNFKVQVKSSEQLRPNLKLSHGKNSYKREDFDFLALYLYKHNTWYLIPSHCLKRKLRINPDAVLSPWTKYKDAWHLISA